jgi:hypothetical protein
MSSQSGLLTGTTGGRLTFSEPADDDDDDPGSELLTLEPQPATTIATKTTAAAVRRRARLVSNKTDLSLIGNTRQHTQVMRATICHRRFPSVVTEEFISAPVDAAYVFRPHKSWGRMFVVHIRSTKAFRAPRQPAADVPESAIPAEKNRPFGPTCQPFTA